MPQNISIEKIKIIIYTLINLINYLNYRNILFGILQYGLFEKSLVIPVSIFTTNSEGNGRLEADGKGFTQKEHYCQT